MNPSQAQIDTAFAALSDNPGIIYGVLKRLAQRPSQSDYDDLYQVGVLAYVDGFCRYLDPVDTPEAMRKFNGYLYQRIYWAILMELRKNQRYGKFCASVDPQLEGEEGLQQIPASNFCSDDLVLEEQLFTQLVAVCNQQERLFLHCRTVNNWSTKQIAVELGCTPRTVRNIRQRVGRKLKVLLA